MVLICIMSRLKKKGKIGTYVACLFAYCALEKGRICWYKSTHILVYTKIYTRIYATVSWQRCCTSTSTSSYYYICVLIVLCVYPHNYYVCAYILQVRDRDALCHSTSTSSYCYMCPHATICVSSYLLYMRWKKHAYHGIYLLNVTQELNKKKKIETYVTCYLRSVR